MRTNISLYIGGKKADLNESSFILMNYTQEDLASPAAVKNAFSKQITLPGTPANNDIFGGIWRNDRVTQYLGTQTGIYFDPTRKTDFAIYNERSEVLESGYLRLNGITRKGRSEVEYKVTLYGGLGSFIYGLMYDEDGEKRTLAGLDFMGGSTPASEFNFTLNAAAIKDAWGRLGFFDGSAPSQLWDYINFCAAYNGLPSGTFDANKGILDVVRAGISDGAGTVDGQALVSMEDKYTEWMTKDLRSYLQRPVLRIRALVEAIAASRNNGGWTVNLDPAFFNTNNPYYARTWMTLPIINTENEIEADTGGGTLTWQGISEPMSYEAQIAEYDADRDYVVQVINTPQLSMPSGTATGTYYMDAEQSGAIWMNVLEIGLRAYDAGGNLIADDIHRLCSRQVPDTEQDAPMTDISTWDLSAGSIAIWNGGAITFTVAATGIKRVTMVMSYYKLSYGSASMWPSSNAVWPNRYDYNDQVISNNPYFSFSGSTYSYNRTYGGRSNRPITKADILSGGGTPADYLLGICKMFGLVMIADGATKTVDILQRKTFFDGAVVDLTDGVDIASIEKEPFAFSARWYVWAASYDWGEWAKTYKDKYGKVFGQMRVNTGFDFDANSTEVLDGIVFKGAVMAQENGKYYCRITEDGKPLPSVLLDRGAKFTRVVSETTKEDVDINKPGETAIITWMNAAFPTYDVFPKPQLHDAENKAADGSNVLLFFETMVYLPDGGFVVTDDTPFMINANGGTPCWLLDWWHRDANARQTLLPRFSRYMEITEQHQGYIVGTSLDYGTPSEIPIPDFGSVAGGTVYDQYWKKYVTDRYDDDSAVIRCKVHWGGRMVNASLLRHFYWFDGALWALNKITNHSVTTDDLTECEFVKIQDTNNYTTT